MPGDEIERLKAQIRYLESESAGFAAQLAQAVLKNESLERRFEMQRRSNAITLEQLGNANHLLYGLGYYQALDCKSYYKGK